MLRKVWSSPRSLGCATLALGFALGCADDSDGVSYKTQIRPLLQQRECTLCHYPATELDLFEPFVPEIGLFVVENTWFVGHGGLQYNVVPGDPDASFLMQKVTDLELTNTNCVPPEDGTDCANAVAGLFMPPSPARTTPAQVEVVRQWILAGAGDTPQFRNEVVPFFGKSWAFGARSCSQAGFERFCVPCFTCHYEDAPTTPNLKLPNFEDPTLSTEQQDALLAEWLATVVGVKSRFRADLDLVAPGDPDSSFLLMKLAAQAPSSDVGAPMPYAIEPLSEANVDLLRRWILEGARNN